MAKKKTICLEDGQVDRLVIDSYKMGKGRKDDICPTVESMVNERVPEDIRLGKAHKKKDKDILETVMDAMPRKAAKKVKKSLVERLGSLGDLI